MSPAQREQPSPEAQPTASMNSASDEFSTARQVLPECEQALLIVDFINPLNFDGGQQLAPGALAAARATGALRRQLASAGVPILYANDNYGLWQSNFQAMVAHCRQQRGDVGEMTRLVTPGAKDIAILKPRHSAFYGTPLELLLNQMKVQRLVLAGLTTDMCVLMTAADAYLRHYPTWVPADCTAAQTEQAKEDALRYLRDVLQCDTRPSSDLDANMGAG